jgi:hypothetical protein
MLHLENLKVGMKLQKYLGPTADGTLNGRERRRIMLSVGSVHNRTHHCFSAPQTAR